MRTTKFFKIVNPESNSGGIYFASAEDIFAFIYSGTSVYEVEPIGKIHKVPGYPKRYWANEVSLKHVGKLSEINTIKYLIENGADIHADNGIILSWSAGKGHIGVVKYLIELYAELAELPEYINQALCYAVENNHLEVVKYLVNNGADLHVGNEYLLCYASSNGFIDIVKYLVKQGADISARNGYSIKNGHAEVVEFLKFNQLTMFYENEKSKIGIRKVGKNYPRF